MNNSHITRHLSSFLLLTLALTVGGAASAREATRPEPQPAKTEVCQTRICGECTTDMGFEGRYVSGMCLACI